MVHNPDEPPDPMALDRPEERCVARVLTHFRSHVVSLVRAHPWFRAVARPPRARAAAAVDRPGSPQK